MGVINLLTKFPDHPSECRRRLLSSHENNIEKRRGGSACDDLRGLLLNSILPDSL